MYQKIKNTMNFKSRVGKPLHLINEKGYNEMPHYTQQDVTVSSSGLIGGQFIYGQQTGLIYSVSPSWERPRHVGGISNYMYSLQAAHSFPAEIKQTLGSYGDLYQQDVINHPIRLFKHYYEPSFVETLSDSVARIKAVKHESLRNTEEFETLTRWGKISDYVVKRAIKAYATDDNDPQLRDAQDIDAIREDFKRVVQNSSTMEVGNQLVFTEPCAIYSFHFSKETTPENVQYAIWAERVKVLIQDSILREFGVWLPPYPGDFIEFKDKDVRPDNLASLV